MFPDYLDGAKVLEYTDKGHFGFITDYDEDNVPIEKEIRYLAICQYTGEDAFYLFSCDEDHIVVFDHEDAYVHLKDGYPDSVWHKKSVPYLYTTAQRKEMGGTCYFEFQRGRFRGQHWLDRSVFLHADLFDELKLYDLFAEALPHFNYYGPTEVTPGQYETLKSLAMARGGETAALMEELDHWVQDCFYIENVFTICGI